MGLKIIIIIIIIKWISLYSKLPKDMTIYFPIISAGCQPRILGTIPEILGIYHE